MINKLLKISGCILGAFIWYIWAHWVYLGCVEEGIPFLISIIVALLLSTAGLFITAVALGISVGVISLALYFIIK